MEGISKKLSLWILLVIAISAQAQSDKPVKYVVSVFAGPTVAKTQGMEYNSGLGLKGGAIIKKIYIGAMVAIHSGEDFEYYWPGIFQLGWPAGTQHYHSKPLFVEADAGYTFNFKLGGVSTTFLPYISYGILRMKIESDGVYGEPDDISEIKYTPGFGLSYLIWINEHVSVGADYRMYPLGDEIFIYGDISRNTYQHGFSTSLIFGALYGTVCYKF